MKLKLYAKKIKVVTLFILILVFQNNLFSQCKPMIKIDGKATVVDFTDGFGLALPFWLTENQTLAIGSSVNSISVIEFKVNGTTLEFSRVINVTSTAGETVPQSYVWKIESVAKQNNSSTYNKATFSKSGSYSWIVPDCAEEICIDLWGAGGGGGGGFYSSGFYIGGGGGGGGYASKCYNVNPGDVYTITVGKGGNGGNAGNPSGTSGASGSLSSVSGTGITISATGGGGGGASTSSLNGGSGGNGNVANSVSGANGASASTTLGSGGGGAGGNGGAGGDALMTSGIGNPGTSPGGGGSGGRQSSSSNTGLSGGAGADGKVIIS